MDKNKSNAWLFEKKQETSSFSVDSFYELPIIRPRRDGRLAQLGEHRPYKAGVTGSSPVSSTTLFFIHKELKLRWTISSVGRAPPLQGGGHWFKPSIVHHFILYPRRIKT